MRPAAVGAAVRHCPSGVVVRLGASKFNATSVFVSEPGAPPGRESAAVNDEVAEVAERLLPAARTGPVDSRAVAGRLRRHLTASASATCCQGRRPRRLGVLEHGHAAGAGLAPGNAPNPIDAAAAALRFTAAPELGQAGGLGAGGLVAVVAHSLVSLSAVFSRLLVRGLLLPSRDPYFVQCEPISGRL